MQSVRYLNREFNRTNLLGSYGFFPKAARFRFLNDNEMIMMMIMIKRVRITKANTFLASHAGVFRGARISSLPTNACSIENNIPFPLFYLRGT